MWKRYCEKTTRRQSLHNKRNKKRYINSTRIIAFIFTFSIICLSKYYYDQKVFKQKIDYQKQIDLVNSAKEKAYLTREDNDIKKVDFLIQGLHMKDKVYFENSMDKLAEYINNLKKVTDIISREHEKHN